MLAVDNLASTSSSGIFGPIAAFFGAVEPQLRGSLHVHMLLYIYGFNSPQSLLERFKATQPLLEKRLAAWVESILQTSVEQVADTWAPQPDAALAMLRPLPYNDWQKDALGEDQRESFVSCPGPWYGPASVTLPDATECCTFFPYPLQYLAWGPEAPAEEFAQCLLWDYRASLLACQMHACRAGTCSKGWLGRHGFCRLGFWHWQDVSSPDRPYCWLRRHGRELRCPASVRQQHPGLGTFETERRHHWIARHNLAILLTRRVLVDVHFRAMACISITIPLLRVFPPGRVQEMQP